ncbi:phosphosulfolactate synthase [Nocardia takedensis]
MTHPLTLPDRASKPRTRGLTMVLDGGLPIRYFEDLIHSAADHIDLVKFGWGTALATAHLRGKVEILDAAGIKFMFGGTLFEKYVQQGKFDAYRALCLEYECPCVEVSNGTIDIPTEDKAEYINKLAAEFEVLAEVGFKDTARSDRFPASRWTAEIRSDLAAGAERIVLEARESGTSGICRSDGTLRFDLVDEILAADFDIDRLLFEAPTKTLQSYFIGRVGPNVNLGNIAASEAIALETLRLGLRADTMRTDRKDESR